MLPINNTKNVFFWHIYLCWLIYCLTSWSGWYMLYLRQTCCMLNLRQLPHSVKEMLGALVRYSWHEICSALTWQAQEVQLSTSQSSPCSYTRPSCTHHASPSRSKSISLSFPSPPSPPSPLLLLLLLSSAKDIRISSFSFDWHEEKNIYMWHTFKILKSNYRKSACFHSNGGKT